MSETIPVVVGLALTIVLVRWIFNNRMLEQPRAPPTEAINQLSTMFPNVPTSVIRSELVRGGSVQAAIERLLTISPSYPSRAPAPRANPTAQLLPDLVEEPPIKVDSETWTKDQSVREKLLVQRKQEMLLRARRGEKQKTDTLRWRSF
ncbi:hypothetical protein PSACC_01169, partial [Paramicrosporidium saccamoebae]